MIKPREKAAVTLMDSFSPLASEAPEQNKFLHYGLTRLCNLDVEAVVADKTKEGAITIAAIIPQSFSSRQFHLRWNTGR